MLCTGLAITLMDAFVILLFYLQESNISNRLFQVKTSFN